MVIEYSIVLDGRSHPVVISDEPEALLAAKAAGRAIIGVEGNGNKWNIINATNKISAVPQPIFYQASTRNTKETARAVFLVPEYP